jgi:FKBP12-rapamycin complex-associated protein
MLAELEEIIDYKQMYENPEHQAQVRRTWTARLKGCQRSVEVWQRILRVRALVITPKEDSEMYIKFANLCRASGRIGLSAKILTNLLDVGTDLTDLVCLKLIISRIYIKTSLELYTQP